ncbi:hypothetical protein [Pontibacter mangrovi]|uniref:Uncharacterized protein n=1 Tax=Pontibacter mangrovi TaxID=2589816 RepID=A0A501W7N4_9BACT|nr:hypothetical protein [Pontibacter mangrovi]TPE43261.1 hypothetical protein FJM65_14210 [Pontibacter mangrovi]
MKNSRLLMLAIAIWALLARLPAEAQLRNNYYFAPDSKVQVNKLNCIAIVPAWVSLDPMRYEGNLRELNKREKDTSAFMQNLLFSALIRTDTLSPKKLQDMYTTNEKLARANINIPKVALELTPTEICKIVEADAALLTFVSYDNSFVITDTAVARIVQSVQWNKPFTQKDIIVLLYHKSGHPIWAASFRSRATKTSIREENQVIIGDFLSIYGYTGKKANP